MMDPERLAALLHLGLADLHVIADETGAIEWTNDTGARVAGPLETWRGRNLLELLHPDDHPVVLAAMGAVVEQDTGALIDCRIRRADGGWVPCEVRGRFVTDDDGHGHYVVTARDTSDRQQLELGGGDVDTLRALVHHATAVLVRCRPDGSITSANAAFTRVLGHDVDVWRGRALTDLVVSEDRPRLAAALTPGAGDTRHLSLRATTPEGRTVHLDAAVSDLVGDSVVDGFLVSATDVTELRLAEAALRHIADHDALTGLLSRRALIERLTAIVHEGEDEFAVLFCDLDGFKAVNDELGHEAGDAVLVEVARRLERTSDADDVVARLGGDEFVVVKRHCDEAGAAAAAARLRSVLRQPLTWRKRVVVIDASIGVATSGGHPTASRLLATADDAMFRVKRARPRRREHLRAV